MDAEAVSSIGGSGGRRRDSRPSYKEFLRGLQAEARISATPQRFE